MLEWLHRSVLPSGQLKHLRSVHWQGPFQYNTDEALILKLHERNGSLRPQTMRMTFLNFRHVIFEVEKVVEEVDMAKLEGGDIWDNDWARPALTAAARWRQNTQLRGREEYDWNSRICKLCNSSHGSRDVERWVL